jgi:flagellar hook-basal body complex protein FliE
MAIKTEMQMQNLFKAYDANKWAKSAEIGKNVNVRNFDTGKALEGSAGDVKSFGDFLAESISKVNDLQKDADYAVEKLASGESKNLHETLLAVERAEIAFKTMNQIRGKVIDAYKEIMKMQV